MTLSTSLPKAWHLFVNNKRYLLLTVLFEFLFLFALVQLHVSFFVPTAEAALRAGEAMQEEVAKLSESELLGLEGLLLVNEKFMAAYRDLVRSLFYFFLSVLAAWVFLRSPVWFLSYKSVLRKIPIQKSLFKFSLLSIFWFAVVMASFLVYSLLSGSSATVIPLVSSSTASILFAFVAVIIACFAQISFALVPAQETFKKSFTIGIKHAKEVVPAFVVNSLIVFVACTLPFNWIQSWPLLALAIILFVTIPALALARLHLIVAVWSKNK